MLTSIIVAKDKNNAIGKNNELPWHLSDDLRMFRRVTTSHAILMGRKTYDSIGKPLPNRLNIILSRNTELKIEGASVVNSIDDAYVLCEEANIEQLFIIGGGAIFSEFLDRADNLYLTDVAAEIEGADVFFPDVDLDSYYNIYTQSYKQSEKNDYDFKLNILQKK